jgi:hypothetical protein
MKKAVREENAGLKPPPKNGSPTPGSRKTTLRQRSERVLFLVRVAEKLASEHNIFIPIGKVPAYNRRVLATAYDPPSVEL